MNPKQYAFPPDFLWGTAASAYQVEGHNRHSDWARWEMEERKRPPARRRIREPCGRACDHWNRFEEDYELARSIGVQVHRPSVEWSRIYPREKLVDREALAHYRTMLQALQRRGIKVMLCLNHFTLPLWAASRGGYTNAKMLLPAFEAYVETVVQYLGDLVDYWLTVNEPNVIPTAAYLGAVMPPFKSSPLSFVKAFRTFMAMHSRAYRIIKERFPRSPVGVAYSYFHLQPLRQHNPLDRAGRNLAHLAINRRFFQGIAGGRIGPPLGLGERMPGLEGALDFIGINYYSTSYMKGLFPVESKPGDLVTEMGWIYYPRGLYEVLHEISRLSPRPIIITENGIATTDESFRIRYLEDHLKEIHRALADGIEIRGYMHWSLTDNFEWQHGYSKRFGLIGIDYATLERKLKTGGQRYARIIGDNGFAEPAPPDKEQRP
ncbi:MAG: glycoside hydrolase family 1 protein [Firmicutes bacterium]|nr:glycoside hydrolase family 1 protein [Bacillota bacterium]